MRRLYIVIIILIFVRIVVLPMGSAPASSDIAETVVREAQVPNAVTGILLRNRLYDTLFEIFVFTLAVLGVQHTFSQHDTQEEIVHLTDPSMVILARIGAMVSALIFLELAIRGHLAPGGGFAAGVAGGTAVGLVTLTGDPHELHARHVRWHIGAVEKWLVLLLVVIGGLFLSAPGLHLADRPLNTLGIPLLNILIACKVAIGSWTIVLLFIRHRGLF
jgi:multicomponent Na+:H+ antiporter subunit B